MAVSSTTHSFPKFARLKGDHGYHDDYYGQQGGYGGYGQGGWWSVAGNAATWGPQCPEGYDQGHGAYGAGQWDQGGQGQGQGQGMHLASIPALAALALPALAVQAAAFSAGLLCECVQA